MMLSQPTNGFLIPSPRIESSIGKRKRHSGECDDLRQAKRAEHDTFQKVVHRDPIQSPILQYAMLIDPKTPPSTYSSHSMDIDVPSPMKVSKAQGQSQSPGQRPQREIVIGYKSDCPKCLANQPGHFIHIVPIEESPNGHSEQYPTQIPMST